LSDISKRLPQDISNLLALCIRDLIWYKTKIISFLRECDVPEFILIEVARNKSQPTLVLVQKILEELYKKGDEGFNIAKTLLTKIYYWKDIHSVPVERKDDAIKSLRELQKAYKTYMAQEQFKKEEKTQLEREERVIIKPVDHSKLSAFRDRFDRTYFLEQHERGTEFEKLLNEIFHYYFQDAFNGFNRTGEQVDGQFYFDGHWYYVEIRWRKDLANAGDISILRDRARRAFSGDVRAVFISYNGFSPECIESLETTDERVVLLTGYDFRYVLECDIALDVLLHRIQAFLVRDKINYISVKDILEQKK
jgi:hypothetical protein